MSERREWPPILGLGYSVVVTLTYLRGNRVQCELAETYGVSQLTTISRAIVASHRARARWYTTKTEPSDDDMTIKLRRVIIAARIRSPCPEQATPQEARAVLTAWAAAGT